jgi:hypothetical protein
MVDATPSAISPHTISIIHRNRPDLLYFHAKISPVGDHGYRPVALLQIAGTDHRDLGIGIYPTVKKARIGTMETLRRYLMQFGYANQTRLVGNPALMVAIDEYIAQVGRMKKAEIQRHREDDQQQLL